MSMRAPGDERPAAPRAEPPLEDPDLLSALFRRMFRSPLYRLALRTRPPRSFFAVAPDNWPGDAARGERLLMGEFTAHGRAGRIDVPGDPAWQRPGADTLWLGALHGFEWLRDLRDCASQIAANMAAAKVDEWIEHQAGWSPLAWSPEVLADRMVNWIRHYDFLAGGATDGFAGRYVASLAVQLRHMRRVARSPLAGARLLRVLKALIFADLAFVRDGGPYESGLAANLGRLRKFLPRYVLADGVVGERSPQIQLRALRDLVDIRAALISGERAGPAELEAAIDRMAPMLRFFRHGDNGLALFNGSQEGDRGLIDLVLARSGSGAPAPREAPYSGFQRLNAGTSYLIVDAGSPPARGLDLEAHAGTLSFEFGAGRDRIVVNCGSYAGSDVEWRKAMRFTAAHSTVVIDNVNSSEIGELGAIDYRAGNVPAQRQETSGAVWIEAQHDGYKSLYGAIHKRRLYLSADGVDLRGEDTLVGVDGKPIADEGLTFAARFHLHPTVKASMVQSGAAAILRLPSGKGWRMRASGGSMNIVESVYLGIDGQVRRTEQIVLIGPLPPEGCTVKWAFSRLEG
jgi:uncharacterized heparinase superfamily protein